MRSENGYSGRTRPTTTGSPTRPAGHRDGRSCSSRRPRRRSSLGRVDLVRRVAEERGFGVRPIDGAAIGALWAGVARAGATYRLRAGFAEGPELVAALHLGRRWPAEIRAGLARGPARGRRPRGGLDARPPADPRRGDDVHDDPAAGGPGGRAPRGRAGRGRRRRARATRRDRRRRPTVGGRRRRPGLLRRHRAAPRGTRSGHPVRAPRDGPPRGPQPRRRGRRGDAPVGEAWAAALPGPASGSICERNLDSASLAASLLHSASELYEPAGHLYGRARTTGAPIVLDRFAHESHNAIVLGQTGKGKTMFTGAEMARCFMRGIRVMGVDPLGDYRRLDRHARRHLPRARRRRRAQPVRAERHPDRGRLRGQAHPRRSARGGDGRRPLARRAPRARPRDPGDVRGGRHRPRPGDP